MSAKWYFKPLRLSVIIGTANDMLAIQYQAIMWPMLIYCSIDHGEYTKVKIN